MVWLEVEEHVGVQEPCCVDGCMAPVEPHGVVAGDLGARGSKNGLYNLVQRQVN